MSENEKKSLSEHVLYAETGTWKQPEEDDETRRIPTETLLDEMYDTVEADEKKMFCRDLVLRTLAARWTSKAIIRDTNAAAPEHLASIWSLARKAWDAKPEDL